jgi:hypothetical protein
VTYSHPQPSLDAFDSELFWFDDPTRYRDCRFSDGQWHGPAPVVAEINARLGLVPDA